MRNLGERVHDIDDLRRLAQRRLTRGLFEFIDRGSEDDVALRNNRAALEGIKIRPRVLNDVSARDPGITLFGRPQKLPLIIGPTGPAGYVWFRGEIALARAAADAGVPFTLASSSNTAMETVLAEGGGQQWFQLYVFRDLEASLQSVTRARDAGFEALVLTVDSIVRYNRKWDTQNGMSFPVRFTSRNVLDALVHPRWLFGTMGRYVLAEGRLPRYANVAAVQSLPLSGMREHLVKNDTMTWDFLRRVRDLWPRTLIVKGVLDPRDAVQAADCGADGVVVSNHGGIASDASMAPIDALPDVVGAVGDRMTVMVDSGFRRGSDVLKAIALGAKAVMLGRATLYGSAAAGEAGARRALAIFDEEIRRTMAVLGCVSMPEITSDLLHVPSSLRRRET